MRIKERVYAIFDYISEFALYGLIFMLPISKAGVESLLGFMLLGFIVKKTLRPDFRFLYNREHLALLCFAVFISLSLVNSGPYFDKSLAALFTKWFKYGGIFIFVQDILSQRKRMTRATGVLLVSAGLLALDAVFQRFTGVDFFRHRSFVEVSQGVIGINGPFNHYNDFGSYLIVLFSVVTCIAVLSPLKPPQRAAVYSLGALLAVALFLTSSRGAWLGSVVSLCLIALFSGRSKKTLIILAGFAVVLLLLPSVRERIAFTFSPTGDSARFTVWKTALRMIAENPFLGKGLGTFMDYFSRYAPNLYTQYAHNCFLQIWAESGLFSLLSFLVFCGLVLWRGVRACRMSLHPVCLGLLTGLTGFLVHSFFDTQLYSLQLAVFFWVCLGFLASLSTAGLKGQTSLP